MAAGLAQLNELINRGGWSQLEDIGSQFEKRVRHAILGKPLTFHRIGSMFCLYFREGPVRNLAEAQQSDREKFAKFFHYCLDRGCISPHPSSKPASSAWPTHRTISKKPPKSPRRRWILFR